MCSNSVPKNMLAPGIPDIRAFTVDMKYKSRLDTYLSIFQFTVSATVVRL